MTLISNVAAVLVLYHTLSSQLQRWQDMVISFPKSPPGCSIIQEWEAAGASLVASLANYVNSCLALSKNFERNDVHAINLIKHIDLAFEVHSAILLQLSHSGAYLSRTRNKVVSPLHHIPEEVLSEIFQQVVYDPKGEDFSENSGHRTSVEQGLFQIYRRRHNLLSVCSAWKNIILARSSFWSTISLTKSAISSEALATGVQRAGGSKLRLAVTAEGGLWRLDRGALSTLIPHELSVHIPQIHSLIIQTSYLPLIRDILGMFLQKGIPCSLSELWLCQIRRRTVPPDGPQYLFSHDSPMSALVESLSTLRISASYLHWDPSRANNLSKLQLQYIEFTSDKEMIAGLRSISSAPRLRHLEMNSVHSSHTSYEDVNRSPTISFPNLQSLTLDDLFMNDVEAILRNIVFGSFHLSLCLTARSFNHRIQYGDQSHQEERDAETLIKTTGVEYTTALLLPWSSQAELEQGPGLSKLLGCMPRLETLWINGWKIKGSDWDSLSQFNRHELKEDSDARRFPRLKNLHLTDVDIYDEEGLRNVVRDHRLQLLELGARKRENLRDIEELDDFQTLSEETMNWLLVEVPHLYLVDPDYIPPEFHKARCEIW